MIRLRKLLPDHPLQLLTGEITPEVIDICEKNSLAIDVCYTALNAENAAKLRRRGIKINCWTVNEPADAEKLISLGADFITTNILE